MAYGPPARRRSGRVPGTATDRQHFSIERVAAAGSGGIADYAWPQGGRDPKREPFPEPWTPGTALLPRPLGPILLLHQRVRAAPLLLPAGTRGCPRCAGTAPRRLGVAARPGAAPVDRTPRRETTRRPPHTSADVRKEA